MSINDIAAVLPIAAAVLFAGYATFLIARAIRAKRQMERKTEAYRAVRVATEAELWNSPDRGMK